MKQSLIIPVIVIIALVIVVFSLFLGWTATTFTQREAWGYDYGSGWQTSVEVTNKETAFQAFVKYYSQSDNSYLKEASEDIAVNDIYFGVIKNVNTGNFNEIIPELSVWKLNNSVLYNKAVDANGTIYTGGILPNPYASEIDRAT